MCGLAGLVVTAEGGTSRAESSHLTLVKTMCELIQHRGPDDAGVHAVGPVVLGARRLSILDLSAAGHMPMGEPGGRWWIVYNGEVYNFADIRAELQTLGHRFHSHTDTEVILHAWMQWGRECLPRLNGMFAFAIADTESGAVVLVRDRYGVKPLYYTRQNGAVLFASEIKALLAVLRGPPRVDIRGTMEWLLYRSIDSLTPETLFEGIESLQPGHLAYIAQGRVATEVWYSPRAWVQEAKFTRYRSAEPRELVAELDGVLHDAVRLRLVSDVPVGSLLSGGLDSCLVTAIAAQHTPHMHTFHVSIEGFPELDERRHAEALTERLKLPFIPLALTGREFRRELAHSAYLSDLPLTHPNTVAYSLICAQARRHGVIVLLCGEGADELFGGYAWNYRRQLRLMQIERLMKHLPKRVYDIAALLTYSHAGLPVSTHRFREVLVPTVDALDRFARRDWHEQCAASYGFVPAAAERAVLGSMLADLSDFLTPLLRRLDRASMGASVECREPFLDYRLVHRAVNLPLNYRVGRYADKWVLKQVAARYMPRALIARKKAGFPLPLEDYLAPLVEPRFFADGFCQTVLGFSRRGLERLVADTRYSAFGLFAFISLEIWGRLHVLRESVEAVTEWIERREPAQGAAN